MEKLLLKLAQLHIALEVRDGHLDIYDPNNCLTAELISDIKSHKEDILQLLGDVQEEYEFSAIPKAAEKEYYVLSSAQKRMYFLNMLDTESIAYNMPDATFLPGGVDVDRLQLTFAKLFERHEILRTTFHLIDGEPVQKVHPFVDCKIETFQCSRSEFESVINNFTRPFDLSKAPMLRLGVVEVSPQEQYLLIDMHHIISDGVSHDLMLKDFSSLYAGEELPPLHLQYKDYAEWQQSEAQQEELASQKEFWLQEFADQPEVINLPADRARPINKTLAGDVIDFRLSKEQTAQLKALAASEGATAYMLLLSLYYVLLNKLANTEDIVVGTPVAGRGHADLADILGL
ncbi:MAG: condensation domain-containing protein, partial [Bacteroidota bacterium]